VLHGVTYTQCTECGTGFNARTDAAYCSSACRQRAYRNRSRNTASVTVTRPTVDLRPVPIADKYWDCDRFGTAYARLTRGVEQHLRRGRQLPGQLPQRLADAGGELDGDGDGPGFQLDRCAP
jgi:hypothetical protein